MISLLVIFHVGKKSILKYQQLGKLSESEFLGVIKSAAVLDVLELFIHEKVPYVQLSTNCGLDNFISVQILFSFY